MKIVGLLAVVLVASCASNSSSTNFDRQAAFSQQLQTASTGSVCATALSTRGSPLSRQMAEAELAVRDVNLCGVRNFGGSTAAQNGQRQYSRTGDEGVAQAVVDRDCNDFSNGALAQRFFLASGGPIRDPHGLDADGDGLACEWGPQISRIARTSIPRPVVQPVRSTSRCYTGPRGGTYTITSGGNRNYSGC